MAQSHKLRANKVHLREEFGVNRRVGQERKVYVRCVHLCKIRLGCALVAASFGHCHSYLRWFVIVGALVRLNRRIYNVHLTTVGKKLQKGGRGIKSSYLWG